MEEDDPRPDGRAGVTPGNEDVEGAEEGGVERSDGGEVVVELGWVRC